MRVFIAAPFAGRPGHHWTNAADLARYLARRHQVRIVAGSPPPDPEAARAFDVVVPPSPFPDKAVPGRAWANWKTAQVLLFLRREVRGVPDAVAYFVDARWLLFFLLGPGLGIPVAYLAHKEFPYLDQASSSSLRRRWTAQAALFFLRRWTRTGRFRVVCETEEVAATWRPACPASVIPYALWPAPRTLSREEARATLGLPPEACVALLFGGGRGTKRHDLVVEAARRCGPGIHFLAAGRLDLEPDLARRSDARARFTVADRYIPDAEVELHFRAADLVLLPYAASDAGSGVALLAANFERPLVVPVGGYLERHVTKYGSGLVYDGTAPSLAETLDRFAALDRAGREALAEGSRTAAQAHSWETLGPRYEELFSVPPENPAPRPA